MRRYAFLACALLLQQTLTYADCRPVPDEKRITVRQEVDQFGKLNGQEKSCATLIQTDYGARLASTNISESTIAPNWKSGSHSPGGFEFCVTVRDLRASINRLRKSCIDQLSPEAQSVLHLDTLKECEIGLKNITEEFCDNTLHLVIHPIYNKARPALRNYMKCKKYDFAFGKFEEFLREQLYCLLTKNP